MPTLERNHWAALAVSVALHVLAIGLVSNWGMGWPDSSQSELPSPERSVMLLAQVVPTPELSQPEPTRPVQSVQTPAAATPMPSATATASAAATPSVADARSPAFMEAPPAPTAQEWALAATYTLKNSKRYRHTWAQQVRSQMGTAYAGADQGLVRFRVEVAPDGTLVRLDTLWSTSPAAEALARQAVEHMRLPPTPTGRPLVFEKTISFQPFETDGPPLYKNDCLPDPPAYRNAFVWDGRAAQGHSAWVAAADDGPDSAPMDAQQLAECLKQLPADTVEAESAHDRLQLEQWRSPKLGH